MNVNVNYPFISIIVPVYNEEKNVIPCIESLLSQEYPKAHFEIILVDNGSTDSTPKILDNYETTPQISILEETEILNAYGARNKGASVAEGEIFAFIDADCTAAKNWLLMLAENYESKELGAIIGNIIPYNPQTVFEQFYSKKNMSLRENPSRFPGMRAGNCAITRSCFEKLRGFNTVKNSGGDSDFLKRMLTETNFKYKVAYNAIVFHKNYDNIISIFRRAMRFGTNINSLQGDPMLGDNYLSWYGNIIRIILSLIGMVYRSLLFPLVVKTGNYRGRKITNIDLFLAEPLIKFAEAIGLIIGRTFKSKNFR